VDILPLFCEIDDFCRVFEKISAGRALTNGRKRKRATRLSLSEVLTPSVQLSAICPTAIALRDAVVFLSGRKARALYGHLVY